MKEKEKKKNKRYYDENKEKEKERSKRYYDKNKEKIKKKKIFWSNKWQELDEVIL